MLYTSSVIKRSFLVIFSTATLFKDLDFLPSFSSNYVYKQGNSVRTNPCPHLELVVVKQQHAVQPLKEWVQRFHSVP